MAVGWALLGAGRHAERNVLPELKKATGVKLVAVISRDRAKVEQLAAKHGFARGYGSLEDALRDREIQALYDATPDGLHAGNVIAAAQAGWHCLVEKPLAISMDEAKKAVEACTRQGVKLGVVFNQRHELVHLEARRRVLAGDIGEVVQARVEIPLRVAPGGPPPAGGNWRADRSMRSGGIMMSIGDHAFDTLEWITAQQIVEVCAFTDARERNERTASMMLKLSKGALGYATSSSRTPFARGPFEIHGTGGTLILRDTYSYLTGGPEDARPSLEHVSELGRDVGYFARTECFRLEIEQFNRAIAGDGTPMTTPGEGLHALAVIDALYESVTSGRAVTVPSP
jgi:1,5-anhydro-D-fructose reductase (1,5-anhydro-D-mannitol-forming)